MIRNVDQEIHDLNGNPRYDGLTIEHLLRAAPEMTDEERAALASAINKAGRPKMTIKQVACTVLQQSYDDERNLAGEKKLERFKLALKIHIGGDVDLSVDELKTVKDLVGKACSPAIVGPLWMALEAEAPKEPAA